MTISELEIRIDSALKKIDAEINDRALVAGNDLVALITNRVVQRGESFDGSQFSPYSTRPMAAFKFIGKSRNASADAIIRQKAKTNQRLSYSDFRAINNLNITPKNFEFTGEMWRDFGVITTQKSATGVEIVIAGRVQQSEDKINANTKREGKSIIKPNAKELALIKGMFNDWVNKMIHG